MNNKFKYKFVNNNNDGRTIDCSIEVDADGRTVECGIHIDADWRTAFVETALFRNGRLQLISGGGFFTWEGYTSAHSFWNRYSSKYAEFAL